MSDEGGRELQHGMWEGYWEKILSNSATQFWRTGASETHPLVSAFLRSRILTCFPDVSPAQLSVLVPLCGDDRVATDLLEAGFNVVGIEKTPSAVEMMKKAVEGTDGSWLRSEQGSFIVWEYASPSGGHFKLIEGSFFELEDPETAPLEDRSFDVLYDRDAFGAIHPSMRASYSKIINRLLKPSSSLLYFEAKNRSGENFDTLGPPFHISKEVLDTNFNRSLELLHPLYVKGTDNELCKNQFWISCPL